MRASATYTTAAAVLFFPTLATALWDCQAVVDGHKYSFTELKGRHEVVWSRETPPTITNTTFEISPCTPLHKKPSEPSNEQCIHGTQICAVERDYSPDSNTTMIHRIIPISGDILDGKAGEVAFHSLKSEDGREGREGIRLVLGGGKYEGLRQKAVVEFECDPKRTGLEGSGAVEDGGEGDGKKRLRRRGDGVEVEEEGGEKKDKEDGEKDMPSLRFVSYEREKDEEVLRLLWKTKYACPEAADGGKGGENNGESSSWGFFTWFFIIAFLGVAAYLIFGSWLNYNRYGSRGWDLLPHSDTIRDFPYLLKDFMRRVVGTLQGRSYRGGYSAV